MIMSKLLREYYPQNRVLFILFDFFLALMLLSYFVFYQDGYGTIRMVATIGFLLFGIFVSLSDWRYINGYNCWYFLFIILGIFSIGWAKNTTQITSILVTLVRVLLMSYFLYKRIHSDKDIEIVFHIYIFCIIFLDCFVGKKMLDLYSFPGILTVRFGDNFAYNSNTIAVGNVIAIIILIHKILEKKRVTINLLITTFFIFITFLTGSKKGILGLLFGVVLYLYYKGENYKKRIQRIIIAFLILTVAFKLILTVPFLYETIGYRFENMFSFLEKASMVDTSTASRLGLVKYAFELWTEHPLLGVGLNNFSIYQTIGGAGYYAHNNYLELLADLGIIGFALYYCIPLKLAFTKINKKDEMQIVLKTIVLVILMFDMGSVTYQDIRVQIFYMLFYINSYSTFYGYNLDDGTM